MTQPEPDEELMTEEELSICADLGVIHTRICGIMGNNHTNDKFEVMLHTHALQNMVMSQAARRKYPQSFRQLGERS